MARAYPTESQLRFLIWLQKSHPREIDATISNVIGGAGYAVPLNGLVSRGLYFRQERLNTVRAKYLQEYTNYINECSNT